MEPQKWALNHKVIQEGTEKGTTMRPPLLQRPGSQVATSAEAKTGASRAPNPSDARPAVAVLGRKSRFKGPLEAMDRDLRSKDGPQEAIMDPQDGHEIEKLAKGNRPPAARPINFSW